MSGAPRSLLGRPELAVGGYHQGEAALTEHNPQLRSLAVGLPRLFSVGDCCSAAGRPARQSLPAGGFPRAAVAC